MKKSFKRFLSSVLATVMAVAGMSIGMTTTAMAADTFAEVWPNNAEDSALNTLTTSGLTNSAASINMASLTFDDGSVFAKDETTGDAVTTFGMSAVKRVKVGANTAFTITPSVNGTAKIYAYANSTSTSGVTINVTQGTTSVVEGFVPAGKNDTKANVITFDVTAGLEYSIVGSKETHVIAIGIVETSTGETYTWSVDSSKLTGFAGNVTVTAETNAKNTVVSYDGTDYVLKNEYKSITDTTEGVAAGSEANSYVVTPEVSWFVPTRTVGFTETSGNDTTITLTGSLGNSYNVDISATTNSMTLPEDTYSVTVKSGDITPTTLTVAADTTSVAFTYTPVPVITDVTLVDSLNASDLTEGDITANTVVGKFTLIADASNALTVDGNSKTANGLSITKRIKTNGTSSTTKRAIKFTTTEADTTLYVWAISGSSTVDRLLNVWDADGNVVGTIAAPGTSENIIVGGSVVLATAGEYYVGSSNSGVNIYLLGTDKALSGESSSETTTEDPTETTTSAPPVGDDVITDKATLNANDLDVIAAGDADSTVGKFTLLTGLSTESKDGGFVGATAFDKFTTRLKTNGASKTTNSLPTSRAIKFTTSDKATLQLVVYAANDGRGGKVLDGTGATVATFTAPNASEAGIINVSLPSADTYYITSDSAYYILEVNVVVGDCLDTVSSTYADTVDAYAIANVTAADMSAEKLVVTMNGQSVEDTVVYKAAVIDGQVITAEELGADYIYVVKAANAVANNALDAVKDFVVSFVTAE